MNTFVRLAWIVALMAFTGCQTLPAATPSAAPVVTPAPLATPSASPTTIPSATTTAARPAPTVTLPPAMATTTATATPIKMGCVEPPNDYARVTVNGEVLSRRTLWMLEQAQRIYGGPNDILSVTQGSFTPGLKESFGTHDGGGAVDVSVRSPANQNDIPASEPPRMVAAMRQVGFAAWYRPAGLFGPGSAPHIHAIAIGDADLSPAARRQIDGPEGYLRGLDGLPPEYGGPHADPHGGPIVCPWMIKLGFKDMRP